MKPPAKPARHGSSVARPLRARGEESRFYEAAGAPGPASGVLALGRAPGHGAPAAALRALLRSQLAALGLPDAGVTVRLVSERSCRGLNRRFRGKDGATDVLSFPALRRRAPLGFAGYLGDLALCPAYAWRRRGRFDPDFGGEAAFLVLHGLLHLSGRHHDDPAAERAMWRLSRRLHPLSRPWHAALRRLGPLKPVKAKRP